MPCQGAVDCPGPSGDVSSFRSAPSSAVAAFASRRAPLVSRRRACRGRGVDLRAFRSHGGARHRGGACQGAYGAKLAPPPAPARRRRRFRSGPPLQCTRVCLRCGTGLWKRAPAGAPLGPRSPWLRSRRTHAACRRQRTLKDSLQSCSASIASLRCVPSCPVAYDRA